MDFTSGEMLLTQCRESGIPISERMILREIERTGQSRETCVKRMARAYEIMKDAAESALQSPPKTMGGLIGGEACALAAFLQKREPVCGTLLANAITYAMGVLEVNASMGLIVAAPTAGSSGVIPGVFLSLQKEFHFSDQQMVQALFHAGAVGYLITRNATVAGAEGGCQAEVGSASAMAASAAVELMGGSPEQCLNAAASALSNLLGLVCDPVGGLVEAPCQQRNAMGAANALTCAQISLAGIRNLIPFDEMVETMLRVGKSLPPELRETAQGGCACTKSACNACKQMHRTLS